MIYIILYALRTPEGKIVGGFYHDWAQNLEEANNKFNSLLLTAECPRKEIWLAKNDGWRRLVKMEEYDEKQLPC